MNFKILGYDKSVGIFEPVAAIWMNGKTYAYAGNIPGSIEDHIISSDIMIFTGVNDKNGKPIYAGHIFSAYDKKWEVIFSQGGFCLYRPGMWRPIGTVYGEVIGNIYEHPNLRYQKG